MIINSPFDVPIFFNFFPMIFILFFLFVFGFIIFSIVRSIRQWNYNNHQPILTVPAKIISKRAHISHYHHVNQNHMSSDSTSYYITFEVESGSRLELHIPAHEYGLLIEGDLGKLTFQGNRYHKFERIQPYD